MLVERVEMNLCKCGCGQEVRLPHHRFISGHQRRGIKLSDEMKKKLSLIARNISDETRKKLSIAALNMSDETKRKIGLKSLGNQHNVGKKHSKETRKKMSIARIGKKHSKETKEKIAIGKIRCRADGYCDAWADKEFKQECRKFYCENTECKNNSKIMNLHHINLDPLDCRPINFITLCASCHISLHRKLYFINNRKSAKQEDFIILRRKNVIKYIHKENRRKVEVNFKNNL